MNFLRSLLEPDPVKRPNIQQALANRWLNENYVGKVPCNITYPNRYSVHAEGPSSGEMGPVLQAVNSCGQDALCDSREGHIFSWLPCPSLHPQVRTWGSPLCTRGSVGGAIPRGCAECTPQGAPAKGYMGAEVQATLPSSNLLLKASVSLERHLFLIHTEGLFRQAKA